MTIQLTKTQTKVFDAVMLALVLYLLFEGYGIVPFVPQSGVDRFRELTEWPSADEFRVWIGVMDESMLDQA